MMLSTQMKPVSSSGQYVHATKPSMAKAAKQDREFIAEKNRFSLVGRGRSQGSLEGSTPGVALVRGKQRKRHVRVQTGLFERAFPQKQEGKSLGWLWVKRRHRECVAISLFGGFRLPLQLAQAADYKNIFLQEQRIIGQGWRIPDPVHCSGGQCGVTLAQCEVRYRQHAHGALLVPADQGIGEFVCARTIISLDVLIQKMLFGDNGVRVL